MTTKAPSTNVPSTKVPVRSERPKEVGAGRPRRRIGGSTVIGVVVVAVIAAAALWRFATYDGGSNTSAAAGAGDVGTQIAELEKRAEAQPDDVQAWRQLGLLYIARAAEIEDPTYYARSRSALAKAEALAADDFGVVAARATLELAAHQFGPALEFARRAHELRPDSPDGYAVLVDAEVESGSYADAQTHLDEWLAIKPDLAALSRLSYLRELHGDHTGAILAMNQAVTAGAGAPSDRATVRAYLGDQYFASGDLRNAERAYRSSLADAPGNLLGEVGLARVRTAMGDVEAARDRLDEIAATTPAPNVTELLGELNLLTGRPEGAAAAFEAMRQRYRLFEESGANASLEQATAAASYGDPAVGLRHASDAYQARQSVFTADAMGWALTRAGRAGEAVPYVQEALRLGTRSPSFHLHAAFTYEAIGDLANARTHLYTSFELNPAIKPGLWAPTDELAARLGVPPPQRPTA